MTTRPVRKAMLPVPGLGTRFQPATRAMPTVVDKPPIWYAVGEAVMRPIGHQPFNGFAFAQRADIGPQVRTFAQRLLA